jgi:hypothetical protein
MVADHFNPAGMLATALHRKWLNGGSALMDPRCAMSSGLGQLREVLALSLRESSWRRAMTWLPWFQLSSAISELAAAGRGLAFRSKWYRARAHFDCSPAGPWMYASA